MKSVCSSTYAATLGWLALALLGAAAPAQAAGTNNRTFVSVEGSDSFSCAAPVVNAALLSGPCRTIQGAIAKVIDHGEVIILDSGNYGNGGPPLVISQNVNIKTPPGVLATMSSNQQDVVEIQPAAGQPPITVNLVGFQLNGLAANARSGIYINNPGGNVDLLNCVITNVPGAGVEIAAGGYGIVNTLISDNGTGLRLDAGGTAGVVEGGSLSHNSGSGLALSDLADVKLDNVTLEGNGLFGIVMTANTDPTSNLGSGVYGNRLRVALNGTAGISLTELCGACTNTAGLVLSNSSVTAPSGATLNADGIEVSGNAFLVLQADTISGSGTGHPLNIINNAAAANAAQGTFAPYIESAQNNSLYTIGSTTGIPVLFQQGSYAAAECTPSTVTPCAIAPLTTY